LDSDERIQLREWQSAAQAIGIDAIEDLASRPWPCPIASPVLGVYRTGDTAAAWLVIGLHGTWAVACCEDGTVSPSFDTLVEALAVIYTVSTC